MSFDKKESFLNKIEQEAPTVITTSIGNNNLVFRRLKEYFDEKSLLEYKVNIREVEKVFQIQICKYSDGTFRLEIRTPDARSYQITCFHLNKLGFFDDQQLISIEQVVKVSGQSGSEENQRIKELAFKILDQEGLLVERENKSPRWHVGTYNANKNKWIHGQNTEGFIKNFLKVAVIMAHARRNRGFSLSEEEKEQQTDNKEIQSYYPKKYNRAVSPECFKELREKWEEIGLDGEKYVLKTEKKRLIDNGRKDLVGKVRHVSLENCAAGYDILSYELNDRPRFIECKTTIGNKNEFELSVNEWNTAIKYREQFYIYQIKHFYKNPKITMIQDPYSKMENQKLMVNPSAYTVTY